MKVYLIKNEDGIGYYIKDLSGIEDIFSDDDETYTITREEMTEEDYEELPEFDGF